MNATTDIDSMTGPLTITPLTGSIGARVEGADLRREIPAAMAQQIRQAFATHAVLVFGNRHKATAEQQHRLAALFGEPQPLAIFQFLGARQPSINFNPGSRIAASDAASAPRPSVDIPSEELRSIGIAGEFDGWHSDSTFTPWIPRAAVLRAEVIPPVGGDTGFASLCAAYDGLSPLMKTWLADASGIHIVPEGYKAGINLTQYGADAEARFDAEYPPRAWPLVIAHPETGRKALFMNPGYVVHIRGLHRRESHALIRFLGNHVSSLNFVYRHHWHPGDLVLWDELTALHRAPDDFGTHDRKVVRVTAGRVIPTAP
jgi:alpha-ketoglutarate-dependent taurine dioxygenase